MKRLMPLFILAGLLYGGYYFFQNFKLDGLNGLSFHPRTAGGSFFGDGSVPARDAATIKIASFNIQVFGREKLAKPEVMQILADTVRNFDVVAIQEVRSVTDDIIPRFVQQINSTGRHYSYVIGPRLGRTNSKEQYAFVFDAETIEADARAAYTVSDPDDLFQRPPYVVPFRVRGPPPDQAFTFTLINIHTEPDETVSEIRALAQVVRAVRNDGRGEDDVILLGDLNADPKKFGPLGQLPGMAWVINNEFTNTRGTKTYDNILFNRAATVEFTGQAGVFDLIRRYNLSMEQALQVSDHFPIWAEFSAYEGGPNGRIADRAAAPAR
jgi:endonuclease/exonuclease/phosphatase family metal-dependent hydrolase